MRKLEYREFARFLLSEGYSPVETLNLFREIKNMTPEVRSWFLDWFHYGVFPEAVVEGVTVRMLVEEAEMRPINAFITMDWLLTDPEAAKFALTHVMHPAVTEEEDIPQTLPEEPDEVIADA